MGSRRHAELTVAELGQQAARPQTSPGGAKPNAPLDHEELKTILAEGLPQRTGIPGTPCIRPNRYRIRTQRVQSGNREINACRSLHV